MNALLLSLSRMVVFVTCCGIVSVHAADASDDLTQALSDIEHRFDELSFATPDKGARRKGFEQLVESAARVAEAHPASVEALAWQGIVLSTFAGEVSALGAMKYANAARAVLLRAEEMDDRALNGSVLTTLGALYARVPGGFIGFGDDELALEYFRKALEVSPNDLDTHFFLAEALVEAKQFAEALQVLQRALEIPRVTARPLLDDARRARMRAMLEDLETRTG